MEGLTRLRVSLQALDGRRNRETPVTKTSDLISHRHNLSIAHDIWERLWQAMTQLRCQDILTLTQQDAVLTLARNEAYIPRVEGGGLFLPEKEIVCVYGECSERTAKAVLEKLEKCRVLIVVDTLEWKHGRQRRSGKIYHVDWDEIDRLVALEKARIALIDEETIAKEKRNAALWGEG